MRLRATIAGLAVLLASAVAAPPAPADKLKAKVTPVIPNIANYRGHVKSKRDKCVKKRTVQVFQVGEPPVFIGEARTDRDGSFELQEYVPASGQVRILVLEKKGCKALEKVLDVPTR